MMRKKKAVKKVFIQVQAEEYLRQELLAIAVHRGVSMSDVVRAWVRSAYNKLPDEAKL